MNFGSCISPLPCLPLTHWEIAYPCLSVVSSMQLITGDGHLGHVSTSQTHHGQGLQFPGERGMAGNDWKHCWKGWEGAWAPPKSLLDSLASPWLQLTISQVGIHRDSFCQGMSSQAMWEPSRALELSTGDSINTREGRLVAASQDPPCWAANSWSSSKSERENFHLLPRLVPPCLQRLRWVWGNFILNQKERGHRG